MSWEACQWPGFIIKGTVLFLVTSLLLFSLRLCYLRLRSPALLEGCIDLDAVLPTPMYSKASFMASRKVFQKLPPCLWRYYLFFKDFGMRSISSTRVVSIDLLALYACWPVCRGILSKTFVLMLLSTVLQCEWFPFWTNKSFAFYLLACKT